MCLMIAQDFGPERAHDRKHSGPTVEGARTCSGPKDQRGLLREAQAGAASAVCQMAICEATSLDEAIQSALSDLRCVDGAEAVRILNPTESSRAHG